MKLTKENIQKMVLAAMVVFGFLYYYFSEMLGPLDAREASALRAIPTLEPQIKDAKIQLNTTRLVETSDPAAVAAREVFDVMKSAIPEGASIAWFPQKLSDFFEHQGAIKATFRPNSMTADPDLPGYKDSFWAIDIPRIEFIPMAIAIAGLENQQGLSQIISLQIEAFPPPDMQYQHAQLTISTIVKQ